MGTILKVNGVFIKDPSKLEYQRYDLDSEEGSGRNQLGEMMRDRVAVKRKLVCQFPPMHDDEISKLLQAVKDEFITLEFPDPYLGRKDTMTCYVGDRTTPAYMYNHLEEMYLWEGLSMNFIER